MKLISNIKKQLELIKIKNRIKNSDCINLNIGAGTDGASIEYKNWISIDIDILNITKREDWTRLLGDKKADHILAEHVWEHLTDNDTHLANKNCYEFLKPGGTLRIAVPDGNHQNPAYIEDVKPNGKGQGAHDHKILYTYDIMKKYLEKANFKVTLLEYWDENKKFHANEWSSTNGHIKRSKLIDARNKGGELVYTSLLVDGIK